MAKFKKLIYNTTEVTNINRVIFNGVVYDRCNYVDVDINVMADIYGKNATTFKNTWAKSMPWSLTSSNTTYATIIPNGQGFVINGITYTPSASSTQYQNGYGIFMYTMPSGSDVGTSRPSVGPTNYSGITTDYTTMVNYYSTVYTTQSISITRSISINTTTGVVSGDISDCTYTTKKVAEEISSIKWYTSKYDNSLGQYLTLISGSQTLRQTKASAQYKTSKGMTTTKYVELLDNDSLADDADWVSSYKGVFGYSFNTISWNDNITSGGETYTLSSGQGTTSAKYKSQKESYNPDLYITFSFKASTGAITWNTSGTYTSTFVNNVKNHSSIDVQPRYYYTHNATLWQYVGSELVEVVRASKEKLTLRFYI